MRPKLWSLERADDGARRDEDATIVETLFGMRWIDGEVEMGAMNRTKKAVRDGATAEG